MEREDGVHEFLKMFEHKPGIQYRRTHYELWIKNKCLGSEFPVYPKGYLVHRHAYDKARNEARKKYYSLESFDN